MQCIHCDEIKLSLEYPLKVGGECCHPALWCIEVSGVSIYFHFKYL